MRKPKTETLTTTSIRCLVSPGGVPFSDFRGYEDWSAASSARTEAALPDEILKVIVANPTMIKAYKAGVPGNGQPFPDGSMIVKLQWKPKKSTEAPFSVDVPDVFQQAFVMEKDRKRFAKSGGWGYAVFNYDAASDKFTPDPKASRTADTRATRRSGRRTTSSTRTRSVEPRQDAFTMRRLHSGNLRALLDVFGAVRQT